MSDAKWNSPSGHPISSHATDKLPAVSGMGVAVEGADNAHGHDANYWYTRYKLLEAKSDKQIAEAVKVIKYYAKLVGRDGDVARDFLSKVR